MDDNSKKELNKFIFLEGVRIVIFEISIGLEGVCNINSCLLMFLGS